MKRVLHLDVSTLWVLFSSRGALEGTLLRFGFPTKKLKKVSFDVVSLFTKVSTGDALRDIEDLLAEDGTLRDRTILLPTDIVSLTGLCLNTTYFHFGGNFYEQVEGAAMGSPLSPVVANIYRQDFESRVLVTAPRKPLL